MQVQLPLSIQLSDDALFASFHPGNNQQAFQAVCNLVEPHDAGIIKTSENFIYLWGTEGVGRSHLLQAACQHSRDFGIVAIYIPLEQIDSLSVEFIRDLESMSLVCIDDLQCIAGNSEWEEALFHLFNRLRSYNSRLLVSADCSPKNINIDLADLKSRLSWGITYHLQSLSDEQKLEALAIRAKARGLEINKLVGQFLLSRCPRNMSELFSTLERLDRASLASKQKLTIPFVKKVLGI